MSAVRLAVPLDLTPVNVGLPAAAGGLGLSGAGLTSVIHAYALTVPPHAEKGGGAARHP
ncbi:hypothetical protein ACWGLE_11730 [Streptomyces sp. NPDC055897]